MSDKKSKNIDKSEKVSKIKYRTFVRFVRFPLPDKVKKRR